ncbi:hypothetical protein H4S03_003589 [Coemansia sp. S3946]|nr:hypothetical protein H4S03_003589 [Coemansia sp. S3946]
MADNSTVVSDCSAQQYCTRPGIPLNYNQPFVIHWNNQLPPLNPESLVSIAVYSTYDLNKPIFQQTGVSNTNGQATLTPNASWFSRYTGDNPAIGQNQQVYFAVYLQGNDVPAVSSMLQLQLTATDAQYQAIQNILHPPPSTTSTTHSSSSPSPSSTAHSSSSAVSSTLPSSTVHSSTTATTNSSGIDLESGVSSSTTDTHPPVIGGEPRSDGLSGGQIAGIVIGSLAALLLLILLLLLPMYRRRQRRKRMQTKSAALAAATPVTTTSSHADSGHAHDGSDEKPMGVSAIGGEKGQTTTPRGLEKAASDTPLLLFGGRPNNSFTSQDGVSIGMDSQVSPPLAHMQPLSLESPRILMSMPSSTRSAKDPILSTDDARQIGDIFRDALRKPPPPASEDGNASDSPAGMRESMMLRELEDDQLEDDDDPGWRERVASERMQRELQQEASVIRSVAMRAHGSDYSSSSRPDTPRSAASRLI